MERYALVDAHWLLRAVDKTLQVSDYLAFSSNLIQPLYRLRLYEQNK